MDPARLVVTNPFVLFVIIITCITLIVKAKKNYAIGIFLATTPFAYAIKIGPFVLLWVNVLVLILTIFVYLLRSNLVLNRRKSKDNDKIVIWILIWFVWAIFINSYVYGYDGSWIDFSILYIIFPILIIHFFINSITEIKELMTSFIVSTDSFKVIPGILRKSPGEKPINILLFFIFKNKNFIII